MKAFTALVLSAAIAACASTPQFDPSSNPARAVEELLAADRSFSSLSEKTGADGGLASMFAHEVTMPAPRGRFVDGRDSVVAALRASIPGAGVRLRWAPLRGGISADGQHGFTFGYMMADRTDSASVPLKYLSYWVKRLEGWRVVVYKRVRRAAGDVSLALLPPALPPRMVSPVTDPAALEAFRESIDKAERAFSDEAQVIGLGPAFAKYGSADAANMGGPSLAAFVFGPDSIARAVTEGSAPGPSEVSWAPARVLIASSGDLGITIGLIRLNKPQAGQNSVFSFFTIWRRASLNDPWRYVAE